MCSVHYFVMVACFLFVMPSQAQSNLGARCSQGGTIATDVSFVNDSFFKTISIYWVDESCQEVLYYTLNPKTSYTQSTFVGHIWHVRDKSTRILLQETTASATTITVRITDTGIVYLPVVLGLPTIPGRYTYDQPDDTGDYQVHIVYAIPSDGIDQRFDINGALKTSVMAFQKWMSQQTNGRSFRIDTYQGQYDITFVRLSKSDEEIQAAGAFVREAIEEDLKQKGFDHPQKIYGVYYGGRAVPCGGTGAAPPTIIGKVASTYFGACENSFAPSIDQPGYLEFVMAHELVHTLGFVAACAPHSIPGNSSHVNDDSRDLMYAGPLPWQPSILDIGRDDYFEHHIPGCLDLANSAFLNPSSPNAEPPPGWP